MTQEQGIANEASENALAAHLTRAIARLHAAHIENPQLDARLLFGHALGLDRAQLLSQSQRALTPEETAKIDALIARREKRESVARILGKREFWGLDFALNEATLEPRPDSETLVEAVLRLWNANDGNQTPRLLDLGTGTGCLLLALLHEWPNATGIGVDIALRAAQQASENAQNLGLAARAEFRMGDWLSALAPHDTFDIVISNPPYIPAAAIANLMPEVRDRDPTRALDGGTDGLDPYRFLIPRLAAHLNPDGLAAFEVGQGQAPHVAEMFRAAGFQNIALHRDLGGIERCVTAQQAVCRNLSHNV